MGKNSTMRVHTRRGSQFAVTSTANNKDRDRDRDISTRRATITEWRTKPFLTEELHIGDDLPQGWTFARTNQGTPYYINHDTRDTQWTDPRLDDCLKALCCHDDIRLAVYRAAAKVRDFQVFTRMSQVHLIKVMDAFYALDFSADDRTLKLELNASELEAMMQETFKDLAMDNSNQDANIISRGQIIISWLLYAFDRSHSGKIPMLSAKIALALLSVTWVEEKYRYVFGVLDSDQDGKITREELAAFIQISVQVLDTFREGYPFCPNDKALEDACNSCIEVENALEGSSDSVLISLDAFLEWCMEEKARPLKWLPTLHRMAATENLKHETRCAVCKHYPIIGFRYRSLDRMSKDVCQECYWTGREGNGHKASHKMREYCLPTTGSDDFKDFGKRVGKKFSKMFKNKKKKPLEITSVSAQNYPPLGEVPPVTSQPLSQQQRNALDHDVTDSSGVAKRISGKNAFTVGDADINAYKEGLTGDDQQMSTVVVSLETQQKLHLLRVIDELDSENRDLVRQLMEVQDTMTNNQNQPPNDDIEKTLQERIDRLNMRNNQLVNIVNRLQQHSTATMEGQFSEDVMEEMSYQHELDDEFDDIDVDALDLDEITKDTSNEQEFLQAMEEIESVFARLNGSHRDSMLEACFNPFLLQSLIYVEQIGNGVRHAVLDILESVVGNPIPNKPTLEHATEEQRLIMHGGFLPENASDAEIETHSQVLRRGRSKLKATLNRLSVYNPDATTYQLEGSNEPVASQVSAQHLWVEVEMQNKKQPVDSRLRQLEAAERKSIRQTRSVNTSFQATGQYTYEESGPADIDIDDVDDDLEEADVEEHVMPKRLSMDALKHVSDADILALSRIGDVSSSSSTQFSETPIAPDSMPPPPPADGHSSKLFSNNSSSVGMSSKLLQSAITNNSQTSILSSTPSTPYRSRVSSNETLLTPFQKAQRSRELLDTPPLSSRLTQQQLLGLETSRNRSQSGSNQFLEENTELGVALRRVGGKHQIRHLSMERKKLAAAFFRERLIKIQSETEEILCEPIGVAEDDVEFRLLGTFANGQTLCRLVNIRLEQIGKKPVSFYDESETDIGTQRTVSNFNAFLEGWTQLGWHPADAPAHLDFNQLSSEFKNKVKDRTHHKRIVMAMEKLLNIVHVPSTPSRNPPQ
eukprot:m.53440 g.53440  ORF g.53440 m.53440 type:complete len:1152 (+) comp7666_c0_seq1:69-3524(+)